MYSPYRSIFVPLLYLEKEEQGTQFFQQRATAFNSVQQISSVMVRVNEQKLTEQPGFGWMMPEKPFLSIGDVANLLQVSNRTVYNLIYKGTLRACRLTYHITLITKEDFFLMIKETTYCKRNLSIFAKRNKMKKKMKEDIKTDNLSLPQKKGKEKPVRRSRKRQPSSPANFKQTAHSTSKGGESAGGDLYTLAEICQKFNYTYGRFYNFRMRYAIPCTKTRSTKCFPKADVDRAMAAEEERLGNNLSEHWYSCFDIMRLFGLGKTQVRRFALAHGVRTKRIHGNRLFYLKEDWDAARMAAERKSSSTKAKRECANKEHGILRCNNSTSSSDDSRMRQGQPKEGSKQTKRRTTLKTAARDKMTGKAERLRTAWEGVVWEKTDLTIKQYKYDKHLHESNDKEKTS